MRLVERRDYLIDCNWKVYVDNYLEGYHLPIAHPGLFREIDYDQYRVDTYRYYSKQHAPIRDVNAARYAIVVMYAVARARMMLSITGYFPM